MPETLNQFGAQLRSTMEKTKSATVDTARTAEQVQELGDMVNNLGNTVDNAATALYFTTWNMPRWI